MDLRQIGYAVAVADEGGFTRAAAAVHISQSALSQAVRALEEELGTPLFHRLGRTIRLTPAGEAFLPPARQTLRGTSTIRAAVDAVIGIEIGHLDVITLPTLAVEPVAAFVGAYRRAHPGVVVRLEDADEADTVAAQVLDGRAEIGFAELPAPAAVVAVPLLKQEIVAVCPPGTELPGGPRLPLSDLRHLPLVTLPAGTSTRRLVGTALEEAGIEATVAVETTLREALVPLVLAGAGTTFLPAPMAEAARAQGAVVVSLDPPVVREIGLVHRDAPLAPAAAAFVALVRELAREE